MVRPENELFFANAAGIREAVVREVNARAAPVKVVLVDMRATSDLDAPSADTLVSLRRELGQRDVHLVLAHVITPVREALERADATKEIGADDIYRSVVEAVRDYLVTEAGDPGRRELVHMGLLELRDKVYWGTSAYGEPIPFSATRKYVR